MKELPIISNAVSPFSRLENKGLEFPSNIQYESVLIGSTDIQISQRNENLTENNNQRPSSASKIAFGTSMRPIIQIQKKSRKLCREPALPDIQSIELDRPEQNASVPPVDFDKIEPETSSDLKLSEIAEKIESTSSNFDSDTEIPEDIVEDCSDFENDIIAVFESSSNSKERAVDYKINLVKPNNLSTIDSSIIAPAAEDITIAKDEVLEPWGHEDTKMESIPYISASDLIREAELEEENDHFVIYNERGEQNKIFLTN